MTATVSDISEDRSARRTGILLAGALVGLVFLAHGPALRGGFVWDDFDLIIRNPMIHASDGLWRFWFTTQAPDYFPLTSTTWWLEWRIWGDHPAGYHLVNLLLHAASALFIWQILIELSLPCAWLAAAIWAVHPVQVESVAWIAEGKNTLSLALAAAAMWLFLRSLQTDSSATFCAAVITFIAALLAKTAVAPLPAVILAVAIYRGRNLWRAFLVSLPFAAAAVALSLVTIYFQSQRAIATDVVRTDSPGSRIAIAGRAVWFYLGKLIWPQTLSFVYPRWNTGEVSWQTLIPLAALFVAFIVLWISRHRLGWGPALALAYFVLMLLPVLGLINIYFMRYSLVADHWQYAASIGPIALFAAVLVKASGWLRNGLVSVVLLALILLSQRQAMLYHTGESLWRDTIAKNPASWMAEMNLGHTYANEHRYVEADQCYQAAAALAPNLAEPYYSIASIEAEQGRFANAATEYERAIEIDPHVAAFYVDKGHSLMELNQLDLALPCFQKAIFCSPHDANLYYQLGLILEQMGQRSKAIEAYTSAVTIESSFADAHYNLARCLLAEHRVQEAALHFSLAAAAAKQRR